MPPLGSRLRAILKNMQKTASRANEKLELLRAGKQCGRNKGDIWSVALRAPCPVPPARGHREPPAPARGDRARAAVLCSPLPKTPGRVPPGAGTSPAASTRGPCPAGATDNGEERLAEHPPGHPLERYGEMKRKRAFRQRKSCCSNNYCVYFPFFLDRRFLILS